jgi:hypothetical protein
MRKNITQRLRTQGFTARANRREQRRQVILEITQRGRAKSRAITPGTLGPVTEGETAWGGPVAVVTAYQHQLGIERVARVCLANVDSPVQRVGLNPTIPLPFIAKMDDPHEREARLPHTAPTWRGPDRRAGVIFAKRDHWSWPQTTGKIGPCDDAEVCHALRALGARRPQIAKSRPDPR